MNRRMILHILGRILLVEALLMLPSVAVGIIYSEKATLAFLIPIALLLLVGAYPAFKKPQNITIYARDGFFIVASAWILMSLAGSLPFWFSGFFNSYIDCFFEIVSGFTTTGASVLSAPEELPHCILFWRSFSHWIGGMGVLVFVLAIMPLSDDRSLHLMRAEAPGPIVGKLVPRMRDTAKILYAVYSCMTLLLILLLILGKMPVFDAFCNGFATAGTGGFGIHSQSIALYNSAYIEIVIAIFMLLFGINFNLFYLLLIKKAKHFFKNEELRWYLVTVAVATVAIALNLITLSEKAFGLSLRQAFFQVASIISSTGFSTFDFGAAPQLTQHILLLLMIPGACAGSTGGGLKVSRLIILVKSFFQEIRRLLHPRSVSIVRLDGKRVDNDTIHGVLSYFVAYIAMIFLTTLLLSFDKYSFATNFSAAITCTNNIGPGLDAIGPAGNFAGFSVFSKFLLSFVMLFGRLEILPMVILFTPDVWRKNA